MKNKKKIVLLLVPSETASGGIKNYFQVLKDEFSLPVEYMIRGARNWPYRSSIVQEIGRAYKDLKLFRKRISKGDISLVQTSTSLGPLSVIRDGLFVYYANKKGIATIVFFRGWNISFEKKITKYYLSLFKYIYFRANKFIVLSSVFRDKLIEWGYTGDVLIESTIINKRLVSNINIEKIKADRTIRKNKNCFNILFLARVEIPKGIYEAIETFKLVKENNPSIKTILTIAGSGKELEKVKNYLHVNNYDDVRVLGNVEGDAKKDVFVNADVYIFPSYTEGMPNSVLEAMAFGLPIITRDVGAIPDIIKNGENGFYTASKEPKVFADLIQSLINNESLVNAILENNFNKAKNNYTTLKVVSRIEKIYIDTLNATTHPTT